MDDALRVRLDAIVFLLAVIALALVVPHLDALVPGQSMGAVVLFLAFAAVIVGGSRALAAVGNSLIRGGK